MKRIFAAMITLTLAAILFTACQSAPQVNITKATDLNDKKLAVQAGTTGETYVEKNVTGSTILSFKSGMDAALDLKNGNVDAIVLDELPAKSIVEKNSDLIIIDLNLEPEEYAIAVKKGNTELVEKINATIKRMKDDGSYRALTDAFMPADGKIVLPEAVVPVGTETLRVGMNPAFAPFEYLNGQEIVGFDVSLSQNIAADQGKALQVEVINFEALISALEAGQIDFIASGMSATDARRKSVDFSDPYYASKQVVIVRK